MRGGGACCRWWAGMAQLDMRAQVRATAGRALASSRLLASPGLPLTAVPWAACWRMWAPDGRKVKVSAFPSPHHLYSGEVGLELEQPGEGSGEADSPGRLRLQPAVEE